MGAILTILQWIFLIVVVPFIYYGLAKIYVLLFEAAWRRVMVRWAPSRRTRPARDKAKGRLLTDAEFAADFPDDTVWDATGQRLVQQGGLNVARAIIPLLTDRGAKSGEPYKHSDYGWAFDVEFEGRKYWLMTQLIDDYILTTEESSLRRDSLLDPGSTYARFLELLHSRLAADGRFSGIVWYPGGDHQEHLGSAHPRAAFA